MIVSLATNTAILLAAILLLWAYACRIRDVSFIDAFWAFGMVLLAWVSAWQAWPGPGEGGIGPQGNLILFLVTLWGMRLGWHLLNRWREHGEDPRYAKILGSAIKDKGWGWPKAALLRVFLLQAPLLFIVCLPAQMAIAANDGPGIGLTGCLGAILSLIGIAFESIGDAQLKAFRADPANKGKVLDTGLWRYTRHPNYFGDFLTWWGIWLVAAEAGLGIALASFIGPAFLSFTLIKWSGAPLLERGLKKSRPGYEDYVARTSEFFPMPPKQ
jgi:steroid 5-alpha reductase family enzyme